ncbi:hypothetical protein HY489_01790 [Candidatus Woesearchaeota archaeon]|nr:hypothetical protein [Candidatus Woesearchaeota archaeon]
MNIQFNPDGSIVVPTPKGYEQEDDEFRKEKVIRVTRKAISTVPLVDELEISLSDHVVNPEKVVALFHVARGKFKHMAQLSIRQKDERHHVIRIESGQFRDTWIKNFRLFLGHGMNAKIQYWGSSNDYRSARR